MIFNKFAESKLSKIEYLCYLNIKDFESFLKFLNLKITNEISELSAKE